MIRSSSLRSMLVAGAFVAGSLLGAAPAASAGDLASAPKYCKITPSSRLGPVTIKCPYVLMHDHVYANDAGNTIIVSPAVLDPSGKPGTGLVSERASEN